MSHVDTQEIGYIAVAIVLVIAIAIWKRGWIKFRHGSTSISGGGGTHVEGVQAGRNAELDIAGTSIRVKDVKAGENASVKTRQY